MFEVEGIESPQHLIPSVRLELTASDRRELEIYQEAPEFGRSLGVSGDAGNEEVIEFGVEGAVEGEARQLRGGIEGVGGGVTRRRIRVEVEPVAGVCATGGCSYIVWAADDGSLIEGFG